MMNESIRTAHSTFISDVDALEDRLSCPDDDVVSDLSDLDGDLLILGASGKMGPTLARMAKRAAPEKIVFAVARFSDPSVSEALQVHGIETIQCDLLDPSSIAELPKVKNVILMAGFKFGSNEDPSRTWATNTLLASYVAASLADCRLVAFSTGCVYPFVPIEGGGATEQFPLTPIGEYANSCVGRERVIEWHTAQNNTSGRLFRLNYAIDLRYGVLYDIASKVFNGQPVDVTTGYVNVIWQGDANAMALRSLARAETPISPLNVTGPETVSVRWLAQRFADRFDKTASIVGEELPTAWLSNASEAYSLFGYPKTPLLRMVDWVADWVGRSMPSLTKPTGFEVRDGAY